MRHVVTAAALAAALALTGCTAQPAATASGVDVVATTTQLGSITTNIAACAGGTSATLMGPGDDPHTFALSSDQVSRLVRAKLVVANGLTLEESLIPTLDNAKADGARIFEVAPLVNPLTYAAIEEKDAAQHDGHAHPKNESAGHEEGHDHGAYDPHVHMDVARMATAAEKIGAELAKVTLNPKYAECGVQERDKLKKVDAEVRTILSVIPPAKRVLITDHAAYNYFADAYDFEIAGVVVTGGSTDAEPSSKQIADLVAVMKEDKVSAIFSNNTVSPKLVDAVAREAGTNVKVIELYEGSVGPEGSGADTYASMMTTDAHRIADALK